MIVETLFGSEYVKPKNSPNIGVGALSSLLSKEKPAGSAGYSMPVMQIRGKNIVTYQRVESDGRKSLQMFRSANMQLQRNNAYSGLFTVGAKKRCTKAITLLVQGTRRRWITNPINNQLQLHQLSFLTLTVSDTGEILDGSTAYKKLLSPFLSWLRKTKGVNTYVWKQERQQNEQIHYHLTMPDFIHYKEIRDKWNKLQKKAGIIDKYRANQLAWHKDGFRLREDLLESWPEDKQRAAYARGMKNNWQDPNSTDVHKVYKVKDLAPYLAKEFGKSIQNPKNKLHYENELEFELPQLTAEKNHKRYLQLLKMSSCTAKVWDCSENLSKNKYWSTEMKQEQFQFLETAVNEGLATKYEGERFCIYKFNKEPVKEALLSKEDMKQFKTWLYVLRDSIKFQDP